MTTPKNLIQEIQKIQLGILKEVNDICKKHNILYSLYGGTLLGAVRHSGFIPWDDDIDIAMLRSDYEKFLKVAPNELSKEYFLQTYNTDKKCIFPFAKIRKNGTLFIENGSKGIKMHQGIFIDIFPLDNVDTKGIKNKLNIIILDLLMRIMKASNSSLIWKKSRIIKNIIKFPLKILKVIPVRYFNKKINKLASKNNVKFTQYVNHFTNGINKNRFNKYLMKNEYAKDLIYVHFEGSPFPIYKEYDNIL